MKIYYNGQRSRRAPGTEEGTEGERKSRNDIRAENNSLTVLKRIAQNAIDKGTEDDFIAEFNRTPQSVLDQKYQPIPDLPRGGPKDTIPAPAKKDDPMV